MGRKSRADDHSKYALWIDPNEVTPYERNAKKHDEKQVRNIANSIRRFGWQQDTVITSDKVLVIGHGRRLAALKLGCMMPYHMIDKTADELTDEDIRELRIADNKTNESPWDWSLLEIDTDGLEFEGFDMPLLPQIDNAEWFDRTEREGSERQEGNDEYGEFLEKFELKKTTDDCYTPDNIYQVVADWVAKRYRTDKSRFVRPFFPGGDYQHHEYPNGCAVVDNPPFSILAEIIDFYVGRKIPFFLFAPGLACIGYTSRPGVAVVCEYASVTYENGAVVVTSFITNMESSDIVAITDTELYEAIEAANDENEAAMHKHLPKYDYPYEVLTSAKMGWLCKYGQCITLKRDECVMIRALDEQKEMGGGIYGAALLLSERAAAERAAAERAAAERAAAKVWTLSDREREIVKSLR